MRQPCKPLPCVQTYPKLQWTHQGLLWGPVSVATPFQCSNLVCLLGTNTGITTPFHRFENRGAVKRKVLLKVSQLLKVQLEWKPRCA